MKNIRVYADWLYDLAIAWELDTIVAGCVQTVHDNAANMIKTFDYVVFSHGDCINHTLQLVVNDEVINFIIHSTSILKWNLSETILIFVFFDLKN